MYKDAKEELKRLEDALRAEDTQPHTDEPFPVYNADDTDVDLEEFSEEVSSGKDKAVTALAVIATVLALGVLGMLVYLLVRYGSIFL